MHEGAGNHTPVLFHARVRGEQSEKRGCRKNFIHGFDCAGWQIVIFL